MDSYPTTALLCYAPHPLSGKVPRFSGRLHERRLMPVPWSVEPVLHRGKPLVVEGWSEVPWCPDTFGVQCRCGRITVYRRGAAAEEG